MRVLFIRHAEAADKAAHKGNDLLRPLTDAGRETARAMFRALRAVTPRIDLILTSEAVRARETAEILRSVFRGAGLKESPLLNPGADFQCFRRLLAAIPDSAGCVAIVGHEPDFSGILADVIADGTLRIVLKKASVADVDVNQLGRGELRLLIQPSGIKGLWETRCEPR
jgi:phosphohistidine phosphatase